MVYLENIKTLTTQNHSLMYKKIISIFVFGMALFSFSTKSVAQNADQPSTLVYTLTVDGLTSQEQVDHLDKAFKQKVGIISGTVSLQEHKVVVKTTEEITYLYVCDILLTEGIKSQNYIVTKE